jgi:hypothetical protein
VIIDPGNEDRSGGGPEPAAGEGHGQHGVSWFKWEPSVHSARRAGIVSAVCTVAACVLSLLKLVVH